MMTISRAALLERIDNMKPNETVVYHIGSIMFDRMIGDKFAAVHATALAAWEALEAGKVYLFQKRRADNSYEYRALKRRAPFKPAQWRGPYAKQAAVKRPYVLIP